MTRGETVRVDYDPLRPPDRDDPYAAFARMHAADLPGAVHSEELDAYLVIGYDDVVTAAADTVGLSSSAATVAPDPPRSVRDVLARTPAYAVCRPMVSTDPPQHTRLRRHLARSLARRAARMEPWLRRACGSMVGAIARDGGGDLRATFCSRLPIATIMELLDVPADRRDLVVRGSAAMVALQWGGRDVDQQLGWAADVVAFHEVFADLVARRRDSPGDDLISDVAVLSRGRGPAGAGERQRAGGRGPAGADEGELTVDEVVRQLTGLFTAGHETTANLIAHAVLWLLSSGQWQRLVDEPALAAAAVEETLRIDGPVTGMFRRATRDVDLRDATIPEGARVQLVYAAANRDPARFDRPDVFALDRERGPAHVAFGSGVHFCIGATLARLEARIALETLARRLPDLHLAPGFVPRYRPNAAFRGPHEIQAVWTAAAGSAASPERS